MLLLLLVSFLSLITAGCGVSRSVEPVLDDDHLVSDDSFLGDWISSPEIKKEDPDYKSLFIHLTITRPEDKNHPDKLKYRVFCADANGRTAVMDLCVGKVDGLKILQATIADDEINVKYPWFVHLFAGKPCYVFGILSQTRNSFSVRGISLDALNDYMKEHPGAIRCFPDDVRDASKDMAGPLLLSGKAENVTFLRWVAKRRNRPDTLAKKDFFKFVRPESK
jgi:uncharacterized protein YcfL